MSTTNHKELKVGAYIGEAVPLCLPKHFVKNVSLTLCPLQTILKNLPKKRRPCTMQNEVDAQIAVQGQNLTTCPLVGCI